MTDCLDSAVDDVDEALQIVGEGRIACNQVLYHLDERSIERLVTPVGEDHQLAAQLAVVADSPLGHGHFPSPRSSKGRVLAELADARGVTPQALPLVLGRAPGEHVAIPKGSTPAPALGNAAAGDLDLTEEELAGIEAAFAAGPTAAEPPMP